MIRKSKSAKKSETIKDSVAAAKEKIFKQEATPNLNVSVADKPPLSDTVSKVQESITTIGALRKVQAAQSREFIETPESMDFATEVKKNNPGLDDDTKMRAGMVGILSKLNRIVEAGGINQAKENELYKKYETHYETYKKFIADQTTEKKTIDKVVAASKTPTVEPEKTEEGLDSLTQSLDNIDVNTAETAKLLKDSNSGKVTTEVQKPTSIREAISNRVGSYINKAFDDKTIDHYAAKTKTSLGVPQEEKALTATPEAEQKQNPVLEEIKKTNKFLADEKQDKKNEKVDDSEVLAEKKKQDIPEKDPEPTPTPPKRNETEADKKKSFMDRIEDAAIDRVTRKPRDWIAKTKDSIIDKINPVKKEAEKIEDPAPEDEILDTPEKQEKTTPEKETKKKKPPQKRNQKYRARRNPKIVPDKFKEIAAKKVDLPTNKNITSLPDKPPSKVSGGRFKGVLQQGAKNGGRLASGAARAGVQALATGGRLAMSGLSSVASAAAPYALPAAGVLAAGAVGYGVGTVAAKGIDAGLSKLTGSETSLGSWLYDKFNGDTGEQNKATPMGPERIAQLKAQNLAKANAAKANAAKSVVPGTTPEQAAAVQSVVAPIVTAKTPDAARAAIEPLKSPVTAIVTEELNKKEQAEKDKESKGSAPIIVNNNVSGGGVGGNSGGGGNSQVVSSPVRNAESTYERVQMQDFWPRGRTT